MGTRITRGSTVVFTSIFLNDAGAPVSPPTATLHMKYRSNSVATSEDIALTSGPSSWTASWNSSVADAGPAYWHIRADGTNKAATEGTLDLLANPANPVI